MEKGAEKFRRFAEECDIGLEEAKTRLDLCEWDECKARETLDKSILQLMTSAVLEMRDRLNGTCDAIMLVTISSAEYRELVSKAALYDAMCASERGEETPPLPSEVEGVTDEEPPRRP